MLIKGRLLLGVGSVLQQSKVLRSVVLGVQLETAIFRSQLHQVNGYFVSDCDQTSAAIDSANLDVRVYKLSPARQGSFAAADIFGCEFEQEST